jgi:tocopherol cyclase
MLKKGFEGWYFKHQKEGESLAFIPGHAESGAFIQMISSSGSRQFEINNLTVQHGIIRADKCIFSHKGMVIDLPGVAGKIEYGPLSPLDSDIMGPFRFLPMECSHGVISMCHTLDGSVSIEGTVTDFSGGRGYIEKDSGTSFPRSYLWLQCNDFPEDCSVMLSIASIPFAGLSFTGCICALLYKGREYRLATYKGVKLILQGPEHIRLSQGKLILEADIYNSGEGFSLRSPVEGRMSGIIRESSNVGLSLRLWDRGVKVLDLASPYAVFEYVV